MCAQAEAGVSWQSLSYVHSVMYIDLTIQCHDDGAEPKSMSLYRVCSLRLKDNRVFSASNVYYSKLYRVGLAVR